jgi:hypothetical protein
MGVLNTVGWMEGVILIPKRMMSWRDVNVFFKNGGSGYKILFVGLRPDELWLDTGKKVEGVGLIEIAGPVKSPS